jgi:hypothetical protein
MHRIILALVWLAVLLAIPAGAVAGGSALAATTTQQGASTTVELSGAGFIPDLDVQVLVARNGNAQRTLVIHADGSGAFATALEFGPGQGGRYTFTVTGPAGSVSADVVVVETAGGGTGGTRPTMPPTDAVTPASGGEPSNSAGAPTAVLLRAFVAFVAAAIVALSLRARTSRGT